ncbi:VOC family protein [Bacillus sp. FJAT-50079]|uniref:VOC family protein n=1 Tax=Bacillus sp. FJAT-50079 TaxID=2833577 RepID=UPI001BC9E47C|nr:VOC family protein [Bacillus sp. FJAT-50079]MBS4206932.1 VOC family protein [Bacillus sp. FJAT-50079]
MYSHPIINQVALTVKDLERVMTFYQEQLGFQVIDQTTNRAVLSADGKNGLLILEENKNAKLRAPYSTGLYHIAFLLPHRSDLANLVHHFIQKQIPVQGASDHDVSEALYLADPEGNGIEIYIDRSPDTWTWNGDQVYMTTKALDIEDLLKEGSPNGWQGMPAGTFIGHVHLQVSELTKVKQFYCDTIGFEPVLNYGGQALFISKHRYHHNIGLNKWNSAGAEPAAENSTGLNWYSIALKNEKEMKKIVEQLELQQISYNFNDGKLITKDPSGNYIHFIIKG